MGKTKYDAFFDRAEVLLERVVQMLEKREEAMPAPPRLTSARGIAQVMPPGLSKTAQNVLRQMVVSPSEWATRSYLIRACRMNGGQIDAAIDELQETGHLRTTTVAARAYRMDAYCWEV